MTHDAEKEKTMPEMKHYYVYSWMPAPRSIKERRLPLLSQPRQFFASRIIRCVTRKEARAKFLTATNEAGRCITVRLR